MLHSGSRGVGNRMGSYFIEVARKDMQKFFIICRTRTLPISPKATEHFDDMSRRWNGRRLARFNRDLMMNKLSARFAIREVRPFVAELKAINCTTTSVLASAHYGRIF